VDRILGEAAASLALPSLNFLQKAGRQSGKRVELLIGWIRKESTNIWRGCAMKQGRRISAVSPGKKWGCNNNNKNNKIVRSEVIQQFFLQNTFFRVK